MLEIYRRGCVATVADIADGLGVAPAEVDDALSSAELLTTHTEREAA